eukprot:TRINITY_DN16213_c0_g1_i1.p1 TRINITY_DN16213_c0_g1~~TRINITY_DN16213_c0_g1_i1.p1  ORF type:complete len:103 (-),score=16.39 TRINITY_DN16213_c0_g1_i1:6-314(-)
MNVLLHATTFYYFIGALLVMVHACCSIKSLARTANLQRFANECSAIGRNALLSVKGLLMKSKKSKELTAFDKLVRRKLEQRKIEITHVSSVSIANLMMLALL